MLDIETGHCRTEPQLESESCRARLLELKGEFRKMEDMVANIVRYKAKVDQLKQENANRKFSYEANLQKYCDQMSTLERDNVLLRHQVKNMEAQLHGKGDDQDKVKILLERLKMMEVDNSSLVLENEQQRQQYDKCLDEIANQVVQALLAQKTLREECLKLQSRVQDLEIQNKQLNMMFQQRRRLTSVCQQQDMTDDSKNKSQMFPLELWLPDCQFQDEKTKNNERSVISALSLTMPRGAIRNHRYLKSARTKQLDLRLNTEHAERHQKRTRSLEQKSNKCISLEMKLGTCRKQRMHKSYSLDDVSFLCSPKQPLWRQTFRNLGKDKKLPSGMMEDCLSVNRPPVLLAEDLQLMLHSSQTPHKPDGFIPRGQARQTTVSTFEEHFPSNSIDRNVSRPTDSAVRHRSSGSDVDVNSSPFMKSQTSGHETSQMCSLAQSSALQTLSDTLKNLCQHPILCEHPLLSTQSASSLLSGQNYYYDYSDEESDPRPVCRNLSTASSLSLNEFLDSTSCKEFLLDDDLFYDYSTIPKSSKPKVDHLARPQVPRVSRLATSSSASPTRLATSSSASPRSHSRFPFSEKSIQKLSVRGALSKKKKANDNDQFNETQIAVTGKVSSVVQHSKHTSQATGPSDKQAATESPPASKIVSRKINTKMLTGVPVDRTLVSAEKSHSSVSPECHPKSVTDFGHVTGGSSKEFYDSSDKTSWGQKAKNPDSHSSQSTKRDSNGVSSRTDSSGVISRRDSNSVSSRLTSNRDSSSLDQKLTRPGQLILAPEEKNFNFQGFSSGSSSCSEDRSPLRIFESKQNCDMKSSVIEVKKDGTFVHAMNSLGDSSSQTTSTSNSPSSPIKNPPKSLTSAASKVPRILQSETRSSGEDFKAEDSTNTPRKYPGPINTNVTVGYLLHNQLFPRGAQPGVDLIKPMVTELKNSNLSSQLPDSRNPNSTKCHSSDSSFENLRVERSGSKDDGYSTMSSDIHPEILEKFSDTLTRKLPVDCELAAGASRNMLADANVLQSETRRGSDVTVHTQNRSFDLMSDPDSAFETSLHSTAEMVTSSSSHISTSSSDFPLSPCSTGVSEMVKLLDCQGTDFCLLQGGNPNIAHTEKDHLASSKISNSSPASPNSFMPTLSQPPESPRRLAHEFLKSSTVKCPGNSTANQSAPSGPSSKLSKSSEGLSLKQKPVATGIPVVYSNKQPGDSRPQKPQGTNPSSPNGQSRLPKRFSNATCQEMKIKPSIATKGQSDILTTISDKTGRDPGSKTGKCVDNLKTEPSRDRTRKQSTITSPAATKDFEQNSSSKGGNCPENGGFMSSNNIHSNKTSCQPSNNVASNKTLRQSNNHVASIKTSRQPSNNVASNKTSCQPSNNVASNKTSCPASNYAVSESNNHHDNSSSSSHLTIVTDSTINKCVPAHNASTNNLSSKNISMGTNSISSKNISSQKMSVTSRKTSKSSPSCVRLTDSNTKRLLSNVLGAQTVPKVEQIPSKDPVNGCSVKEEEISGLPLSTDSQAATCDYTSVKSSSPSSPANNDIPSVHQFICHHSEKLTTNDLPQPTMSDHQTLKQHSHIVLTNQSFQPVSDSDNTEDDRSHCLTSVSIDGSATENVPLKNSNDIDSNTHSIKCINNLSSASNTVLTNGVNLQKPKCALSENKDCACVNQRYVNKLGPSRSSSSSKHNNHLQCFQKQPNQNLPLIQARNQNARHNNSNTIGCLQRWSSETDIYRKWTSSSACDDICSMVWDSGRVLDRCASLVELAPNSCSTRSRLISQCHGWRTTCNRVGSFRLYQRALLHGGIQQLGCSSPCPPSTHRLPLHSGHCHSQHNQNIPLAQHLYLDLPHINHPDNRGYKLTLSDDTLDSVISANDDSPAADILEQKRFNSQFYSLCQVDSHRSLLSSGNDSREKLCVTDLTEMIGRNKGHLSVDDSSCSQDSVVHNFLVEKQDHTDIAIEEFEKISRQIAHLSKTVNHLGLSLSSLNSDDLEAATNVYDTALSAPQQEHMCRKYITDGYHWAHDEFVSAVCHGECIQEGYNLNHDITFDNTAANCTSHEFISGETSSSELCQTSLQEQYNRFLSTNSSGQDEIFAQTIFDTVRENPHVKRRNQTSDKSTGGRGGGATTSPLGNVDTNIWKSDFRGTTYQMGHEGGQNGEGHIEGQDNHSVVDKQGNEQTDKLASSNNESDDSLASDIGLDHVMCQRLFGRKGHNLHIQSSRKKAVIDATKFFMRYGDSVKEAISSVDSMANLPLTANRQHRSERPVKDGPREVTHRDSAQEVRSDTRERKMDGDNSELPLRMPDREICQLETRDVGIDAMSQSIVSLSACLEAAEQLPLDLIKSCDMLEPISCVTGNCDSIATASLSSNQCLDKCASLCASAINTDKINTFVDGMEVMSFDQTVHEGSYIRQASRPNAYLLQTRPRQRNMNDTWATSDSADVKQIAQMNETAPPKLPPRQPIRPEPGFDLDIPPLPPPPVCLDNETIHLSYNEHRHRNHQRQQTQHFPYVNQFIPSLAVQNSEIFKARLFSESHTYNHSEFSPLTPLPPLPPRLPHAIQKLPARFQESVQPKRHYRMVKRLDERPQSLSQYLLDNTSNSSSPLSSHLSSLATYPGPKHHSYKRHHLKKTSSMDKPKEDSSSSRIPRRRQRTRVDRSKSKLSAEIQSLEAADKLAPTSGRGQCKQWRDIDVVNGLPLSDSSCEDNNSS